MGANTGKSGVIKLTTRKVIWLFGSLLVIAALLAVPTIQASADDGKLSGSWSGILEGGWTEPYHYPSAMIGGGVNTLTFSYKIRLMFDVEDNGSFSGKAFIQLQQPQWTVQYTTYTYKCPANPDDPDSKDQFVTVKLLHYSARISPTEFVVPISGYISSQGEIDLTFNDAPERHQVYTYVTVDSEGYRNESQNAFDFQAMRSLHKKLEYTWVDNGVISISHQAAGGNPSATIPSSYQEEAAGKLYRSLVLGTEVTGDVRFIRFGEELPITPGRVLRVGDTIITGENSQLELLVLDGTIIIVKENAKIEIADILESLVERPTGVRRLFFGKIFVFMGIEPPWLRGWDVHTPSAVTSVRGTEFTLEVEIDGTTTLLVLEGVVEFSDLDGTKTVFVEQYQTSVVKPGDVPSEPVPIDPDKIDRWWETEKGIPAEGDAAEEGVPAEEGMPMVWIVVPVICVVMALLALLYFRQRKRLKN